MPRFWEAFKSRAIRWATVSLWLVTMLVITSWLATPARALNCGEASGLRGRCLDCQLLPTGSTCPEPDYCRFDDCGPDEVYNVCLESGQVSFCISPSAGCDPVYSGCWCGYGCYPY